MFSKKIYKSFINKLVIAKELRQILVNQLINRETVLYRNNMRLFADHRLIVALDLPNVQLALNLVEKLDKYASFYKVGLSMVPIGGFDLVRKLKDNGKRVFLDLKLFDIGSTIERTVKNLDTLDVDFFTVHGDPFVVEAAAQSKKNEYTKILAVTILTSLSRYDLNQALIKKGSLENLAIERASKAFDAGADGIICSPNEARLIRNIPESSGKLIVTPGVRLPGSNINDQKRTATPKESFQNGADFVVLGRPIYQAKDPVETVQKILASIK